MRSPSTALLWLFCLRFSSSSSSSSRSLGVVASSLPWLLSPLRPRVELSLSLHCLSEVEGKGFRSTYKVSVCNKQKADLEVSGGFLFGTRGKGFGPPVAGWRAGCLFYGHGFGCLYCCVSLCLNLHFGLGLQLSSLLRRFPSFLQSCELLVFSWQPLAM